MESTESGIDDVNLQFMESKKTGSSSMQLEFQKLALLWVLIERDTVWPPGRAKDLLQTFAVSMEALKDDFEASKNEPVVQYDDVVSFCGNVTTLYEALSCERNRLDAYYHEKRARQDRRDVLAAEERKFACDERRHRETISYACFRILFGWNTWLYPKN